MDQILLSRMDLRDMLQSVLSDIVTIRRAVSPEDWEEVKGEITNLLEYTDEEFEEEFLVYEYENEHLEDMSASHEDLGFTICISDYVLCKTKFIRATWGSKISDTYKSVGIPVSGSTMICINGSCLSQEQFDMTWQDIRGFLRQFATDTGVFVHMVVDNHKLLPDSV